MHRAPLITAFAASLAFTAQSGPIEIEPLDPVLPYQSSREALDACGGRYIFDLMVPDIVFLEACRTHAACYRSNASDQNTCDRLFLSEMRDACETAYLDADKPMKHHACRSAALTYFKAVNSRFGAVAYADVPVSGAFTGYQQTRLAENDGTDELKTCVTFTNTATRIQRFEIKLRDAENKWVDTEPNFQQKKLRPGESANICVDTDHALHRNWETVGEAYSLTLYADNPSTLNPLGDQVAVDRLACDKPSGVCRVSVN